MDNLDLKQFNIQTKDKPGNARGALGSAQLVESDIIAKNRRKQDVLAGIERLPSLPNIVNEVIRLTNDANSKAEDFVSLFSNEQSLTAKMLRIVNSPFYGLRTPVTTINKAIVILGYKTLKSLVLASSSSQMFKKGLSDYGFAEDGLWLHSVTVASLARHVAKKWVHLSGDNVDELFVVGLMHDIGKIVIGPELSKYSSECQSFIDSEKSTNISDMESDVVGIEHTQIGEIIITKWKIGDSIASAIGSHHKYANTEGSDNQYNAVLVLSDLLCNEMGVGLVDDYRWSTPIPESVLNCLNLDSSKLQSLREEALEIFEEAKELVAAIE